MGMDDVTDPVMEVQVLSLGKNVAVIFITMCECPADTGAFCLCRRRRHVLRIRKIQLLSFYIDCEIRVRVIRIRVLLILPREESEDAAGGEEKSCNEG